MRVFAPIVRRITGVSNGQPSKGQSDSALLAAATRGDRNSIAELYDRYSTYVYSVALRVLRDSSAAEDVLHRVFLKLWRVPDQFDSTPGHLVFQLALIARNDSVRIMHGESLETNIPDLKVEGSEELSYALRAKAVRKLLGRLSPAKQVALELAFFKGLTLDEISEKTGVAPQIIKKQIRAALAVLHRASADECDES